MADFQCQMHEMLTHLQTAAGLVLAFSQSEIIMLGSQLGLQKREYAVLDMQRLIYLVLDCSQDKP